VPRLREPELDRAEHTMQATWTRMEWNGWYYGVAEEIYGSMFVL